MRYIATVFASTIAAIVLYFGLVLALAPAPIAAEYWVREMLVVKRDIARRHDGMPKVLIASGSSTLFNIDTKQLTDALGIPFVNFGLHAALPLATLLEETQAVANRGDTIILPLEPLYYCVREPTSWQVRNMIAWQHDRWAALDLEQRVRGVALLGPGVLVELLVAQLQRQFWPDSLRRRLEAFDDSAILSRFRKAPLPERFAYSAYHLDELGNMRRTMGANYTGVPPSPETEIPFCETSRARLRTFLAKTSSRDVAVYFANTPSVLPPNLDRAKAIQSSDQLSSALSNFAPVLDDRHSLMMDRRFFFDTDLHLNEEGRRLRTQMLESAIERSDALWSRIRVR